MSENVYRETDFAKKVGFGHGDEQEERIVDIYVSAESLRVYENPWVEGAMPPTIRDPEAPSLSTDNKATIRSAKQTGPRAAAGTLALLALLALLLLAGITAQGLLSARERSRLWADTVNLTAERDLWEQSYNDVTVERDQLKTINGHLIRENELIKDFCDQFEEQSLDRSE